MKLPKTRTLSALIPAAAMALLIGCQSDSPTSYSSISSDLTPELMTLTERPVDVDRHIAVNFNQETRMFWGDLGRTFYTDHPSRLTPFPVTPTSGTSK